MLWPYGPGYLYAACWDVDPLKWKTGFSPPVQSILIISFHQYQYQYYKQKKKRVFRVKAQLSYKLNQYKLVTHNHFILIESSQLYVLYV